ncbi:Uncharacterised protein [uncultured Coprococcus sp.]|uniref:phage holin family protein n=1 Tax=Coprococcus ammoniilyticus TaxID=2981785 RepID=UPI000822256A|nr:phage holin family protein [Coprococcus ammoniilyticus]MCU6731112.1 phage holin family protein [Coprococcus ammoniilyticus]SCH94467.1 Uncharacterised protein [uncultured Coprococcus sp.]
MKDILGSLDWNTILRTLWTMIILPIVVNVATYVKQWLEAKKLDRHAKKLYDIVVEMVKAVYQSVVENIKGTDDWTDEKKKEVKELAKTKILEALPTFVYQTLNAANSDFYAYLDSLIETAINDEKKRNKKKEV